MPSFLTKSKFMHALDCPTKLYYRQSGEYKSTLDDNDFLQALAEGGLQVGELAKLSFPDGYDIPMLQDKSASIHQTKSLLKKNRVTIFEAAIQYNQSFVLADILQKNGNDIDLIEVKSKSWDTGVEFSYSQKEGIRKEWQPYLYDIAFQLWVAQKAFPEFRFTPYLMLIDKSKQATVEGLHQHFRIVSENGRSSIKVNEGVGGTDLGDGILSMVEVSKEVDQILNNRGREPKHELEASGFAQWIDSLSKLIVNKNKYTPVTGFKCKNCEYRIDSGKLDSAQKSGFEECWREAHGWSKDDLEKPHIFDIWNERGTVELLDKGIYHMEDLLPGHLEANPDHLYEKKKWDISQRKTVQIMKATGRHHKKEEVLSGLFEEMDSWRYPMHFIDFEAVIPAIPFYKGQRPYQKTPFQFSVHSVYEDGSAVHSAEWIETKRGKYPCFDFIRNLKSFLEQDNGSIFMYHHFENSTLNDVRSFIEERKPEDGPELVKWIDTITKGGDREMIDQQRMVLKYYYSPFMGKSNSIKDVLPAVLSESRYLQDIYSKPYSGLSIKNKVLYRTDPDTGKALSPYKLLDPIGHGIPDYETGEEYVADGGSAMMAWSRMQFDDVPEAERDATFKALLKYCELDTLAMVMIHQHWHYLKYNRSQP